MKTKIKNKNKDTEKYSLINRYLILEPPLKANTRL